MNEFEKFYTKHGFKLINTGGNCSALSITCYLIVQKDSPSAPVSFHDECRLVRESGYREPQVLRVKGSYTSTAKDLIILKSNW